MSDCEEVRSFALAKADFLLRRKDIVLTPSTIGRLTALKDIISNRTTPESLSEAIERVIDIEEIRGLKYDILNTFDDLSVYVEEITSADRILLKAIYDETMATDLLVDLYSIYDRIYKFAQNFFLHRST
jgi:hypothetical protein